MRNLTRAHNELFRRTPDEIYESLGELTEHCHQQRERSADQWEHIENVAFDDNLAVSIGSNPDLVDMWLNDWSFSQLCRMAGVSKDTINRLSCKTASRALTETLPRAEKPMQFLTDEHRVRSVHGVSYTRLWNAELLDVVTEYANDFGPPQPADVGHSCTGLYCGEQDMFCFLIDPTGWAEIEGEAYAPGFFVWNSEVGRRSVGIQTFWFQVICRNHIVWDAVEVVDIRRNHTTRVRDSLDEIRAAIEHLVRRRDERRDGFIKVLGKAMTERLGDDADEVMKVLAREGIPRNLAKEALKVAEQQGALTIFAVVDALTQLTQRIGFAGDRVQLDQKASALLTLAAPDNRRLAIHFSRKEVASWFAMSVTPVGRVARGI